MRALVRTVLRGSLRQVRYVKVVPLVRARGMVADVYGRAERDFGVLAPPLALHSPAPAALAACWMMLRETLLVQGVAGRTVKEVVATEVSRANACPYCVGVHQAVRETLPSGGVDDRIAAWARGTGRPAGAGAPPFPAVEAAEVCGVAVTFHYINRMVSVFLDSSPVPARTPGFLRGIVMRTVARAMRPVAPGPIAPGTSLDLLPAAPLPAGLEWARHNVSVAGAFGRAVDAVEQAAYWVPEPVRERLRSRLAVWDGSAPGLGRSWLAQALAELPDEDVPATRLALLTAFAPYQVTAQDVAAFRERWSADRELVELTSWAALTTALWIGSRLGSLPGPVPQRQKS
jgi:AhpD family alkylhydroperoxidase